MRLKQNIFLVFFTILILGLTGRSKRKVAPINILSFHLKVSDTKERTWYHLDYRKFEDEYEKVIKFKKKDERRKFVKDYSL